MIGRILAALRADIAANQTWYAIIGYVVASAVVNGTRERARIARLVDDTRKDLDARTDEITERMTRAIAEETHATISKDWDA